MTWITRKIKHVHPDAQYITIYQKSEKVSKVRMKHVRLDTHYYLGIASICNQARLGSGTQDITYEPHIGPRLKFCQICKRMLKTEKMCKIVAAINDRISTAQRKLNEGGLPDTALQDMVMNYLCHPDTQRPVKISILQEAIRNECPNECLEYLLITLLTSGRISISDDKISPCLIGEIPS